MPIEIETDGIEEAAIARYQRDCEVNGRVFERPIHVDIDPDLQLAYLSNAHHLETYFYARKSNGSLVLLSQNEVFERIKREQPDNIVAFIVRAVAAAVAEAEAS